MTTFIFGIIGAGFCSQFLLTGWREMEGAECVAAYHRTIAKAEAPADPFGVAAAYSHIHRMFEGEEGETLARSSIVDGDGDLLKGLQGQGAPETHGEDYLKTAELVFQSCASAETTD